MSYFVGIFSLEAIDFTRAYKEIGRFILQFLLKTGFLTLFNYFYRLTLTIT